MPIPPGQCAPSTDIRAALEPRELREFWVALKIHVAERVPEIRWPWERFGGGFVLNGVLCWVAGVVCAVFAQLGIAFLLVKSGWASFSLGNRLMVLGNPLPPGIVTFGDLARAIANTPVSDANAG